MQCQPIGSNETLRVPPASASTHADPNTTIDHLQASVDRLEADLIATQRLALLGTMSAMVAHEINNLVTPILARAEFALSTGMPADMQKALERSRAQVKQVVAVTERLLGLAKTEPNPVESCSVAQAVCEAIETTARPLDKDGVELHVSVPDEIRVRATLVLLGQVLLNLLLNARQAMRGMRGKLTISARRDGQHVIIDVCDSGKGIAPERLQNVVNPFLATSQLDEPRAWQAVGLGLNVCRMIAQQHHATIEALPNRERGCTFRLRWPAA